MKYTTILSPALGAVFAAAFIISAAGQTAKKDSPADKPAVEVSAAPFPLVFHAGEGDGALFADWGPLMDRKAMEYWGKSRGLMLRDDAGPVADGKARFVAPYGSTLVVSGLARGKKYRLWLDFVRYRNRSGAAMPSRLVLSMNGRPVKHMVFSELEKLPGPVPLDIPYDLSQGETVTVLFREHAPSPGFWGLWDVMVTEGPDLPEKIDLPADAGRPSMPVRSPVVEDKKPAVKQKAPRPGEKKPSGVKKPGPMEPSKKPAAGEKKPTLKPAEKAGTKKPDTSKGPAEDKKPSAPNIEEKDRTKPAVPVDKADRSPNPGDKPDDGKNKAPGAREPSAPLKEEKEPRQFAPELPKKNSDAAVKETRPPAPPEKPAEMKKKETLPGGEKPAGPVKNGEDGPEKPGKNGKINP